MQKLYIDKQHYNERVQLVNNFKRRVTYNYVTRSKSQQQITSWSMRAKPFESQKYPRYKTKLCKTLLVGKTILILLKSYYKSSLVNTTNSRGSKR